MLRTALSAAGIVAGVAVAVAGPAAAEGDPESGAQHFRVCAACHSLEPGRHLTGPSLAGIWGREAGTVEGFTRYSEPQRHYHNPRHVDECLQEFDLVRAPAASPVALELAIWFHDAIYDTRRSDNEARSAAWARTTAGERVADLVLAPVRCYEE